MARPARVVRRGLAQLDAEGIAACPVYVDCKPENFLRRPNGDLVVVDLDGLGFGHPLLALAMGLLRYTFGLTAENSSDVSERALLTNSRLDPLIDAYFAEAPSDLRKSFDFNRSSLLLWGHLRMVGFAALRSLHPLRGQQDARRSHRREARKRWKHLVESVSKAR